MVCITVVSQCVAKCNWLECASIKVKHGFFFLWNGFVLHWMCTYLHRLGLVIGRWTVHEKKLLGQEFLLLYSTWRCWECLMRWNNIGYDINKTLYFSSRFSWAFLCSHFNDNVTFPLYGTNWDVLLMCGLTYSSWSAILYVSYTVLSSMSKLQNW